MRKQHILTIVLLSVLTSLSAQIRVLTIGDSTMADYDESTYSGGNEMRGWAQMLPAFVKDDKALIDNMGKRGRSSKSFYNEFWAECRERIKPGDYVFIQFGHNDEKNEGRDSFESDEKQLGTAAWSQYLEYLTRYIDETRERGGTPILFTSVVRGGFDENTGKLTGQAQHNLNHICGNDSAMNYPMAMRALAVKKDVPLIDMTSATQQLIEEYGYKKAKHLVYCQKDDTHLRVSGAVLFAWLAVKELQQQGILSEIWVED